LAELALDGNPVFHNKGYFEFCLTTCPNLKHLDLRKITPDMREGNGNALTNDVSEAQRGAPTNKSNEDIEKHDLANVSTDISPDKPVQPV
jgi:hypothetical protein